ncbi:MAG: tRNA 2-thiouridine(34) synthase MnmA [Candidatus Omnitrophica bacterium]|nr:tRNA 2-thiouridine(34) synthase MnmA [Candidatus Omnitrophota bacterium]MDD5592214.1 tRNA 2-thiouridine(34) synthase MnmA [Candidatus Omnitrophota bacterium]
MKERVAVAMSGGVDSSVAAALLKKQGYEVIGLTMCFNLADSTTKRPNCCGLEGIEDARRVAHKLGIRHYVLNFSKVLKEKVIADFCREYLRGRTPNPCVRCNQFIKFDALLKKALSLDAGFLATGHYARIEKVVSRQSLVVSYLLKKAKDKKKDQSYFLYCLGQKQLRRILFPLGDYTKEEVRNLARKFNLPIADKLASQEICFLPDADYRRFLNTHAKAKIKPGPILDKEGNVLGQHQGVAFYTIGQREGLGIARGYPLYVIEINPGNRSIIVGKKEDVYKDEFYLKNTHFIIGLKKKKVALRVKIRYNHPEAQAQVIVTGRKVKVKFSKPQFAVTPGQSAVFYDHDTVVGGGVIGKVL